MAQTQQQLNALIMDAQYHLEVVLATLPLPPQTDGLCAFDAVVSHCYRSPFPLMQNTPVKLSFFVYINADLIPPGSIHVCWESLRPFQILEIVANGTLSALQVVDGGLCLLTHSVGKPSMGMEAESHQGVLQRPWWKFW